MNEFIHAFINALPSIHHTVEILKDTFTNAIFTNVGQSFSGLIHGNLAALFGLIGGLYLLWRVKGRMIRFLLRIVRAR